MRVDRDAKPVPRFVTRPGHTQRERDEGMLHYDSSAALRGAPRWKLLPRPRPRPRPSPRNGPPRPRKPPRPRFPLPSRLPRLRCCTGRKPSLAVVCDGTSPAGSGCSSAQDWILPGAPKVAFRPVSVSLGSRGSFTSTHSCDMDMSLPSLPASHCFSPTSLAASSATPEFVGTSPLVALGSCTWPLVSGTEEPSSISVRPA